MRSSWISLIFLTAGCGDDLPAVNGQFGEENSDPCEVRDRVEVDWDAPVEVQTYEGPVTFVPSEVLAASQGPRTTEMTYGEHPEYEDEPTESDHPTTLVTAEITHDGTALEWVTFEPSEGLEVLCADRLLSTGTVEISSDDGALDEVFSGQVDITADGLHIQQGITQPQGAVDPEAWLNDVHPTAVRFSLFFGTDDTLQGSLDGVDPSGDFEEDAPSFGFFW